MTELHLMCELCVWDLVAFAFGGFAAVLIGKWIAIKSVKT